MGRERYLDYTKGLAIILMLFAHTMYAENAIHIWIFSFHMPIFFIIGGIIRGMKEKSNTSGKDILALIRKRAFRLGIPYLFFCLVLSCFYTALSLLSVNSDIPISTYLYRIITLQGIDSLWFIPCYFMAEIYLSLSNISKHTKWIAVLLCVFTVIYLMLAEEYPSYWLLRLFIKEMICFSFMLIGFFVGHYCGVFRMPVSPSLLLIVGGDWCNNQWTSRYWLFRIWKSRIVLC